MKKFLPTATELVLLLPVAALLLALIVFSLHFFPQRGQGTVTQGIGLPPLPVSITSPREGERVSGVVPVTLLAPSGQDLSRLEFWVDAVIEKHFAAQVANIADKFYEVNYKLDTRRFADGEHLLAVRAVDLEGRYQNFTVKVNFANEARN